MKHHCRMALGMAAILTALLFGAAGCGKSLRTGSDPNSVTRVTVAATTDGTIIAGQSKKFTALGASAQGEAVPTTFAWKVDPESLGTVVAMGSECLVTGKTPGSGKVIATANGLSGEFPIVVVAGPVTDLQFKTDDPAVNKASVEAGESVQYVVTGLDGGQNVVGASRSRVILSPKWSVEGGIGTITSTGLFTAAGAGVNKSGAVVAEIEGLSPVKFTVGITRGSRALYVGVSTCDSPACHADEVAEWKTTAHATAYDRKKAAGALKSYCVSCHVVGYDKGGWVDENATPELTNIQCESCHGPASEHVAIASTLVKGQTYTPDQLKILTGDQVATQPQICGQCHSGSKHPQYDEWHQSPHGEVLEYVAEHYKSADGRYTRCGVCHSGLIRKVMREGETFPTSREPEAAEGGKGCTTCHNPHKATGKAYTDATYAPDPTKPGKIDIQLRYPKSSTAYYTMNYSAPQWNDDINVCGQCHNHRNASWTGTGRPPHHSGQYNMLIGDLGPESVSGVPPATSANFSAHRTIEGQCTHCHMYKNKDVSPAIFGHTFQVTMAGCSPCHSASDAGARKAATQSDISSRLNAVKTRLDAWALSSLLADKYGKLAWEYTYVGELSNPPGSPSATGPSSADQKLIPNEVKKARYFAYMVLYDGSMGVHNAKYARYLLDQANAQLDSIGVPK